LIFINPQIEKKRIRSLELESKKQAIESAKKLKQIGELKKQCDEKEILLIQEISRVKEISLEYKKSLSEIDSLIDTHERQKIQYEEQIDNYTKEISELKLQLENLIQEQYYQRKSTLYDESYYTNQIGELEIENQLLKNEIQNLSTSLEELQASLKISKNNFNAEDELSSLSSHGQVLNNGFLQVSNTQESFLSEISSTKEEEVCV
jgi:chromosome segregation ATPase